MNSEELMEESIDRDEVLKGLDKLSIVYAKSMAQGDVKYIDLKTEYLEKMDKLD